MKYLKNLDSYILEAKQNPSEIIEKYYSDIPTNIMLQLIESDPTSVVVYKEVEKIGTYVKFLVKIYRKGNLLLEDLSRAYEYLSIFQKNKNNFSKIDIMKFNSLSELGKIIQPYLNLHSGELTPLLEELTENDYIFLGENENYRVYQALSEKGAAYLGTGTEWCTAYGKYSTNKDYRSRNNQFHRYEKDLRQLVSKETDKPVYQLSMNTKQFMDINDRNYFDKLTQFLIDNHNLCNSVFPELKDLNNQKNIAKATSIMYILPDDVKEEIYEKLENFISKENVEYIQICKSNKSSEEKCSAFQKLFSMNSDNNVEYIDNKHIVFSKNFINKNMRSGYDLINYLNYLYKNQGGTYSDEYDSQLDIENYLSDEQIFSGELKKELIKYKLTFIKTLYDVRKYVDNEDEFDKINITFTDDYNSDYNDFLNNNFKGLVSKVNDVIKFEYNSVKIDKEIFFASTINLLMTDYFSFDNIMTDIFSKNDIPSDEEEFHDVLENHRENFTINETEYTAKIQHLISVMIYDKYCELEEERKRNESPEYQKNLKTLLINLENVMNKLKFTKTNTGYFFKNDIYEIIVDTSDISEEGDKVTAKVIKLKDNNKSSEMYITPDDLYKQLMEHVFKEKITEKMRYLITFENFNSDGNRLEDSKYDHSKSPVLRMKAKEYVEMLMHSNQYKIIFDDLGLEVPKEADKKDGNELFDIVGERAIEYYIKHPHRMTETGVDGEDVKMNVSGGAINTDGVPKITHT